MNFQTSRSMVFQRDFDWNRYPEAVVGFQINCWKIDFHGYVKALQFARLEERVRRKAY